MAGLVPAIHVYEPVKPEDVDARDIGERSDAVLRTAMPGHDERGRKRMRYIDAFNHFFPKRYYDALLETPAGAKDLGKRVRGIPALSDIELRLSIVESFDDYTQVLSHGLPPMERLWGPDKSPDMAKIANDGLAEVVAEHPKHF